MSAEPIAFNAAEVVSALRADGLDLAIDWNVRDLGKGRWRVDVVTRARRDPAGERTVVLKGDKWKVEKPGRSS